MQISQNGLNLIKQFEGCRLIAYKDSVGVWTIGWGTTNADKSITGIEIKKGLKISQETADEWLEKSVNTKYAPKVEKYNKKYNFNQNQFDALVSFAYNIGSIDQLTAKGTRTISEIASHITAYNKAGGKVLVGLTRRRNAEKKLFLKPVETKVEESKKEEKNLDDILFDADLYFSLYEDLQKAFGNDYNKLKEHWLTFGINEGRRGSYVFDVHYYFSAYEDLRNKIGANCMELYNHFKTFGIKEGRKGCNEFEVGAYASFNEDLKNTYGIDYFQYIKHFIQIGINEVRKTSSTFDVEIYKNNYEDLQKAFGDNIKSYYQHFIQFGSKESRKAI